VIDEFGPLAADHLHEAANTKHLVGLCCARAPGDYKRTGDCDA
jgi:hypothetical protein